ncbi:MAG: FAD-dependent oxidoreductase [Actinomycetota bacterium]
MTVGTSGDPLRVAIIGSGPSGFYAADELQSQPGLHAQIDMYDRLPTPFGLVRGGVAPDHQKIKSVTRVYDKIASHPEFRFYGNVEFGRDVTHADLTAYYHAIVYAVGAGSDRRMGVPGEHLPGSHSATDFVGWYNGHPDFRRFAFDLTGRHAVIVGNGNVAMDVARILATPVEHLGATDIAEHAIEALAASRIEEITILGRRGPAQAACTSRELKELGEIPGVAAVADPAEIAIDHGTEVEISSDRQKQANVEVLRRFATRTATDGARRVVLRFLLSPVEVTGTDRVEGVVCARNELHRGADGRLRARHTTQRIAFPADIVFRAIGYTGVPLPGVPFDHALGVIPNTEGRVLDMARDGVVTGEYTVGWIKRGPQGVIGTNKTDAQETVASLLEDVADGRLNHRTVPGREVLERLLRERRSDLVTFDDWRRLDALETARGAERGRPRLKFTSVEEMVAALADLPE